MSAVTPKSGFFVAKNVALLTWNTREAIQCVRVHQNSSEGSCHPFKVLTLACAKIFELIILYVGVYSGTYYYSLTLNPFIVR